MFQCPNCRKKGIGVWAKYWSIPSAPAKCKACGENSFVRMKYRFGMQSAWPFVMTWLLIGLALFAYLRSNEIAFLIISPLLWVSGKYIDLAMQPMDKIERTKSA